MKKLLLPFLAALMCLSAFAQEKRMAVVELSTSYLRQKPDYESPLETQELMGTVVEIIGEKSYWKEIMSPQPYRAWCTDQGLVEMTAAELEAYVAAPKVMFMGLYGHVYTKASAKAATLCDLVGGDVMRLVRKKGRWTEVMLPSGRTGFVPSKELKAHEGFVSVPKGEGSAESVDNETTEAVIASAMKLLGVPYLWGGTSAKGVDCSGLVRISYLMNGILLPRNASQQVYCGDKLDVPYEIIYWSGKVREERPDDFKEEMKARIANLQRGDLVFFGTPSVQPKGSYIVTHVGIYLGDNKIIHSSHSVRINSLIPDDPDYYENAHKLVAAIRL